MSADLLVGLDVGTTGIVATLHDARLRVVAEARRPVVTHHPAPGRHEQDPEALLRDAAACVVEVVAGQDWSRVAGLGLDHQGESVVAWDALDGRPLAPLVVWSDRRGASVLERVDPAVLARSGLPADPYFSASKMAWLLEHVPAVAAAARAGRLRLGTLDAFLVDRLGGPFRTDLSSASRTQLLALGGRGWDPRLLDAFGLDAAWLPDVGATWGEHGSLRHPSWPRPLPLRAQVVDQQAALAGAGCVVPGAVKATYGTGIFVLALTGTAVPPAAPPGSPGLVPTVAWSDGEEVTYALDGGVFTAGSLLEWLCSLGLAQDPRALCALAAGEGSSAGVRVLPSLAGLGAPWWRPGARGVVAGLHAGARPGHVAHAALEALAHRVTDVLDALDGPGVPAGRDGGARPGDAGPTPLKVDGGLSRDAGLLRLQADTAGRAVVAGAPEATAAGAAALAAVGAGVVADLGEAAALLEHGEPLQPAGDPGERAAARAAWRAWVEAAAALPA